ncbi:MAG: hypothetical protein KKD39_06025 [Candidatus Altiarchaeota archaeon]|nr:hypothetical protein [Candidatus Altiarchaeota archaeon]
MKKIIGLFFILAMLSTNALAQTSTAATNLVVDFDETTFDSSLSPGDSGIMNLVEKHRRIRRRQRPSVYTWYWVSICR